MVLACSANTQLFLLAFAVGVWRSQVTWKGMKEKDTDAPVRVVPSRQGRDIS